MAWRRTGVEKVLPPVLLPHCGHCQVRIPLCNQEPEEQLLHDWWWSRKHVNIFLVPYSSFRHQKNVKGSPLPCEIQGVFSLSGPAASWSGERQIGEEGT